MGQAPGVSPPGTPLPYGQPSHGQPPYGQPPYGQPAYGQPAFAHPQAAAQPAASLRPPTSSGKRRSLRFLASTCVFSAWITLVVSLVFAGMSFMAGLGMSRSASAASQASMNYFERSTGGQTAPGLGGTGEDAIPGLGGIGGMGGGGGGLEGLTGGNPLVGGMGAMLGLLKEFLPAACYAGGAFTLVTGLVTFVLFLGLGQACYALLDLEQQSNEITQMLQIVAARLGAGR